MTTKVPEKPADWSLTTRKGSRLRQHREFAALPFRRKMELLEEMCERAEKLGATQGNQEKVSRDRPS